MLAKKEAEERGQNRFVVSPSTVATVVVIAFLVLLAWTWRKWPDPLIDFGRELYIPWQLAEGAVLYSDIAYFNGPFSPSLNAALFRLFGASFSTLIWTNVAITALLTALLYRFLACGFGLLSASLGSLVFLTGFAFSHLLSDGNYNYITPYSHDATHGIFLSVVMLGFICRDFRLRPASIFSAGFFLGLVFLTKAEIFLAAACAAIVAIAVPLLLRRVAWRDALTALLLFVLGALVPIIVFVTWLSRSMPWQEAILGVAGTWRWILFSPVTGLYRPMAGLDQPLVSLGHMAWSVLATLLILLALVLYDRLRHRRSKWDLLGIAICLLSVAWLRNFDRGFPLLLEGAPLLLASIAMALGFGWAAVQRRTEEPAFVRLATLAVWATFGLFLLAKVLLVPRIIHYGFVLAMPATLLAVATLLDVLPKKLCKTWNGGAAFRLGAIALVVADTLGFVLMSSANLRHKSLDIASGPDRIVTYAASTSPVGPVLNEFLAEVDATFPSDATFIALPEGVMLNYLSRRRNPTRYINAMPPELRMFGEQRILDDLVAHRPDYVVLVPKDMREYGVGDFGCQEYGESIMNWVHQHYRLIGTVPSDAREDHEFKIEILAPREKTSTVTISEE